jgi:flavin reductase (DIM6/NTAB) family NADH-FMN oxidoreductase RutF
MTDYFRAGRVLSLKTNKRKWLRGFILKKSLGAKTIVPTTPVWVVGTYDREGKPNVMTAAWGGVCCSQPPCIYVSLRKATYTYSNIMERNSFTVSIPSETYAKEADYFGITSARTVDKFSATGLTPVKSDLVDAPYVKEFPLVIECKVIKIVEIGLHTEFIGEIVDVKADSIVLNEKNVPDIERMNPIIWNPAERSYHAVGKRVGQAFSIGKEI